MQPDLPVNAPLGVVRDPRRVAWLTLATFGVYGVVWFYRFGREIDSAGNFGIDPKRWYRQLALLAGLVVTLPAAIIHFFVYAHEVARATERLARRVHETTVDVEGRFPLFVVPFAGAFYLRWLQDAANKVWRRMAQRRGERDRAVEAAAEARRPPTPVDQLVRCPMCEAVITVRYVPGVPATARCTSCGFSAPFG